MHGMVAEGVLTTNAAVGLADRLQIEMPITHQMYTILHDGKAPQEAIRELMTRPGKDE
jgi:glycerol-3-phosphate dehydrogenase (NAD(P)+)